MIHRMNSKKTILIVLLSVALTAQAQVKVTVDHNTGPNATPDFKFNLEPDAKTDPTSCGWKLIASVDTRPKQGASGGQYGVSITDASGSLGKFRYLLFDAVPTESDDAWGNTFFSEIDVVAKK